jgi:hypothetical protein
MRNDARLLLLDKDAVERLLVLNQYTINWARR